MKRSRDILYMTPRELDYERQEMNRFNYYSEIIPTLKNEHTRNQYIKLREELLQEKNIRDNIIQRRAVNEIQKKDKKPIISFRKPIEDKKPPVISRKKIDAMEED